jgi:hypothetical protein
MSLYLSSEEYVDFKEVRKIVEHKNVIIEHRNVIIAKITPPLIGQKYGWGKDDIDTIYLTNKFVEDVESIKTLDKMPLNVIVLIPKAQNITPTSLAEFDNIAWSCLYDNKEDAKEYKII